MTNAHARRRWFRLAPAFALCLGWWVTPSHLLARQQDTPTRVEELRARLARESYITPPPVIADLVTAPRQLNVALTQPSPDRTRFLKEHSNGMLGVKFFGKKHYYFAGLQVDPLANRARSLTIESTSGLELIDATSGASTTINTPAGTSVSAATWSPDGSQLAYIANSEDASHVYVADVATGRSRQVTRTPLLATLVTTIDWTADGRAIVVVLLPSNRGPEPTAPSIATGPRVRLWMDSVKSGERNWASLLEEPFDATLMEYFVTGQLAMIDVRSRKVTRIGSPAMIRSVDASPNGGYFRVTTLQKPFSYVVPFNDFGQREEIWNAQGGVLGEVNTQPTRVGNDTTRGRFGQNNDGPHRGLSWMPTGPGMYYLERVPSTRPEGADSAADPVERRGRGGSANRPDRVMQWLPPFGPSDTAELYRHTGPIAQVAFTEDATTLFLATTQSGTGSIIAVDPTAPDTRHTIARGRGYAPSFVGDGIRRGRGFFRRGGSPGDSLSFYQNPGAMVVRRGSHGGPVAMVSSDGAVFLSGTQFFRDWERQGPQIFVDKVTIATGDKERIYEGSAELSETVNTPLDDNFQRLIVTRESSTTVPNAYLVDTQSGTTTQLTQNVDRTPAFTSLLRKRVFVTRADGVRFLVNLTLPADYVEGTRLPGMLWFYPFEYTDQASYDRTLRTENINRAPTSGTRTIEFLATQGYAVANFNPPIIGEQGRMNDNYVSDLRMNLLAVIDALDRDGYIDRSRLAVGGHSYGAFSTANALVHTPFFKAGIAGDGMYNRSLTPNGFQSERRDLWSGQKTYLDVSPMFYVDKMQGALLMYHGMEDQNVGTTPISSIRMMQALRAFGKPSALFMYPYEAHGPAAKQTLLDLWGRWTTWLDLYVKQAQEQKPKSVAVEGASSPAP